MNQIPNIFLLPVKPTTIFCLYRLSMETVVQKCCVFTILLTLMATKTTAQETSCCSGSQLTVPRPLILFTLLIFFYYVSNCLLANTNEDDDPYALMPIGSELNLVPNQTDHHYYHQTPLDYNQIIGSLPLWDLQEFELMGHIERDNGEQNNLHSENEEELNQPHVESTSECEEMVRECFIDSDTLLLSDSEQIHPMDGDGRSHTENNLPAEVRDLAHEEIKHVDDERCIEHNLRPEKRGGETNELDLADEVVVIDEQMHVNEKSAVNGHINNYPGEITRADLEKLFGMKRKDAAASLGVSESTFKRICRANGIAKWPRQRKGKQPATATSTQSNIGVKASYNAKIARFPPGQRKGKQPATATSTQSKIDVKVSYNAKIARFELSLSSRKKDLEFKIEKRFGMPSGSYCIKYEDEDKDWIDITCDEDLHHGMGICKRRGIATMKMQAG